MGFLDLDFTSPKFLITIGVVLLSLIFYRKILDLIDPYLAEWLCEAFHKYQRLSIAPVDYKIREYIRPLDKKKFDNLLLKVQQLTFQENWLIHYPIDYTFFFKYKIDPIKLKTSLSKLLNKLPIIGGKIVKFNKYSLGIDYTDCKVAFRYGVTSDTPSTLDKDELNINYYQNYTDGASHKFPYPNNEPVFKVTVIHYPKDKNDKESNTDMYTMLSIGCMHSLTDGEGFFLLMRCWANEFNNKEYEVPSFDRGYGNRLLTVKNLAKFDKNEVSLGKYFYGTTYPTLWLWQAVYPSRRWTVKTVEFSKLDISLLKKKALKGKKGTELSKMRLSTNDIITALFWKIRALLNRDYNYNEPIICILVINTRQWLPSQFPKLYVGNALAFLAIHETRKTLIEWDFSEVVYKVRTTIQSLKQEQFKKDFHIYGYQAKNGVDNIYRYHTRWSVPGYGFERGRWQYDRDLMISNLQKLPSLQLDFGNGNSEYCRFNNDIYQTNLAYFFKKDIKGEISEYYAGIPKDDLSFYNNVNIKDPNLNWNEINKKYNKYIPRKFRRLQHRRKPIINWNNFGKKNNDDITHITF